MKKKTTLILLILTFSIYTLNITVQSAVEENYYQPTSLEWTPHDPIEITSDSDLEVFPGTGTEEDPYLIEGYNITKGDCGIDITDTTKYFTIRNCYIISKYYGIVINNTADGTVTVFNNTCNHCHSGNGITILSSGSSTVVNNTCQDNRYVGISIASSDSSTIANNTCIFNNEGFWISDSDFCVVTYNIIRINVEYGIYLVSSSGGNIILHNLFDENNLGGTSQAFDDGTNNYWYDSATQVGNYWSDWSETGSYSIDGSAGSEDKYPNGSSATATPISFTFALLMIVVPLLLTRIISKKAKKE